jgi:hypothetical protein
VTGSGYQGGGGVRSVQGGGAAGRAQEAAAGCAGARDAQGIALYRAAAHPSRRCTHTKGGAVACTALHRPRTQMGFRRAGGWAGAGGADWVGPLARPNPVDFLFFRNIFFQCKNKSRKFPENV